MAALTPTVIVEARQLLVEGRSPELFFGTLLRSIHLGGIQIQNYGGISDLSSFVGGLRNAPDFAQKVQWLGIIRDAELDANAAFLNVCGALGGVGLPVPAQPMQIASGPPNVAIFVLPDCLSPGMLEDLCLAAVVNDPAIVCVAEFLTCLNRQGLPAPGNLPKARLQAFLASRSRPGLLLGQAAENGFFDWAHSAFDLIKQFLYSIAPPAASSSPGLAGPNPP